MLWVFSLLAYALATMGLAPMLLTRGQWRVRRPKLAFSLWMGAFTSGVLAALGAVIIAAVVGAEMNINGHMPGTRWYEAAIPVVTAWAGLAITGVVIAVFLVQSEPVLDADRESSSALLTLVDVVGYRSERHRGARVGFIRSDQPFACAVPSSPGQIIVSSLLEDRLTPGELMGIVEHEYAHLSQRHSLALKLAVINAKCFPMFTCARQMKRSVTLLVELIADDTAARRVAVADLASGLRIVGELKGDEAMLLRAGRLEAKARLDAKAGKTSRTSHITKRVVSPDGERYAPQSR